MGDPRNMPPLSGEIMTGESLRDGQFAAGDGVDVVDADFVTLPKGTIQPVSGTAGAGVVSTSTSSSPQTGLEVLRSSAVRSGTRRAGAGFWAAGSLAALAAFWMSGGHALSRYLPIVGGDPETIRIADLTSRVAPTAAGPGLFIDGEVRNSAPGGVRSPDLLIDVTARDGLVTRYRLATGAGRMASGEARRFSSRLAAPDSGVRSVSVVVDREGRD